MVADRRLALLLPLLALLWTALYGAGSSVAAPPESAPPESAPPESAPPESAPPENAPPDETDVGRSVPETAESNADAAPDPGMVPAPSAPVDSRPLLRGTAGACGLRDDTEPLVPVAKALDSLRPAGFKFGPCEITADVLRGQALRIQLTGTAVDLLLYLLEEIAIDGFQIALAPVGPDQFELEARPSPGIRGVQFVRVRRVSLEGPRLTAETTAQVRRIAGLENLNFYPLLVQERLREIGYRSDFVARQDGIIVIELSPARSLRRVRVYGNRGVPEREVLRTLSINSRPGALARGRCVDPDVLRSAGKRAGSSDPSLGGRPPICAPDDFACRQWESDEVERIEGFLFEKGYLRGTATLALACGSDPREADLQIYIDRGPAYRVDRQDTTVLGAPNPEDEPWIRRRFIPRTLWFFRTPVTREEMDDARSSVERYYAEPQRSIAQLWRRSSVAYPEVSVTSSYEDLDPLSVPENTDLPLQVRVDTGIGVTARFHRFESPLSSISPKELFGPGDRRPPASSRERLTFSPSQLTAELQIFTRRDSPNRSTADREAANLRAFYQRKGYLLAEVGGEMSTDEMAGESELRFAIYEGPRFRIKKLDLPRPPGLGNAEWDRIRRAFNDDASIRRRGFFAERATLEDLQVLLAAYNKEGYLCAGAYVEIGFFEDGFEKQGAHAVLTMPQLVDAKNRPDWLGQLDPQGVEGLRKLNNGDLYVRLVVEPGPQVTTANEEQIRYLEDAIGGGRRVDGIPTTQNGNWGATRILRDTPLRRGGSDRPGLIPVNLTLEERAREAIVTRYQNDGFPVADSELSWRYVRSDGSSVEVQEVRELVEPSLGMCSENAGLLGVRVETIVNVYEGKEGKHGDLLLRGNFKTKDRVLLQQVRVESGDTYRRKNLEKTLQNIEAVGVTRELKLTPYPVDCDVTSEGECVVHQVLSMEEARDIAMDISFGVGGATLNPLYIFAKPSFPNMNGSAWNLDLEGRFGIFGIPNIPPPLFCDGLECYEHNVRGSLTRPRIFGSPVDFDLTGRYQQRVTPARGRIDSAYGSVRLTWRFAEGMSLYGGYLIQLANVSEDVVKPPGSTVDRWVNRSAGIVSDRAGVLETGLVISKVDNPFNPGEGYIAAADFKLASPFLGGLDWFFRADLSWQHFIPIPGTQDRLDFRYSLRYGHAVPFSGPGAETRTVPDIWRYYGGGTAALGVRGMAPETMLIDLERIELPYGGVIYRPRAQGGQIRAISTIAFQVVSLKDFLGGELAHSVFYDSGVLTQFWKDVQFPRDYRHSAGLNIVKYDIKLVTLALGYAWLLPTRGNIGPTDDPNGRVVFDVGITF